MTALRSSPPRRIHRLRRSSHDNAFVRLVTRLPQPSAYEQLGLVVECEDREKLGPYGVEGEGFDGFKLKIICKCGV